MPPDPTQAFGVWLTATEALVARIRSRPPAVWFWGTNQGADAPAALCNSLTDVWYQDGGDGRVTQRHIGVLAAEPELMRGFQRVNAARSEFHRAVQAFRKEDPQAWPSISGHLARRAPGVQQALRDRGLVRLHLKQVSRLVPVLPEVPEKISFTWYRSGRSIKRLSRDDVLKKLEDLGERQPHLIRQYERVASLSANERLAQVQDQAPLIRANVRFRGGGRKAFNAAMPIVYPVAAGDSVLLPEIVEPQAEPPETRQRARRSDQRLEDEPFVPSLRVFRYR